MSFLSYLLCNDASNCGNYKILHSGLYDEFFMESKLELSEIYCGQNIDQKDELYYIVKKYLQELCNNDASCMDLSSLHVYYIESISKQSPHTFKIYQWQVKIFIFVYFIVSSDGSIVDDPNIGELVIHDAILNITNKLILNQNNNINKLLLININSLGIQDQVVFENIPKIIDTMKYIKNMENQEYYIAKPILQIIFDGQYIKLNDIFFKSNNHLDILKELEKLNLQFYKSFQYINHSLKYDYDEHLQLLEKIIIKINEQLEFKMSFKSIYLDLSCWEFADTLNIIYFSNILSKILAFNQGTQELYANVEYWKDVQPEGFQYLFQIIRNCLSNIELQSFYLNLYGWRRSDQHSLQLLANILEKTKAKKLENFYLSISFWQNINAQGFKILCNGIKYMLQSSYNLKSFITNFCGLNLGDQSLEDYCIVLSNLLNLKTLIVMDLDFEMWSITDKSLLQLSEVLVKVISNHPLWSFRLSLSNCEELTPIFSRSIYNLLRLLIQKTQCVYNYIEYENIDVAPSESNLLQSYMQLLEKKKQNLEKLAILTLPALDHICQNYRKEIIWEVAKKVAL
ncbi:hypothetical protein ABPG72_019532 [Tetrahymena utriculariae]